MSETKQMPDLRDQAQRDAITRLLDRNLMVLAGAGAGKTHALIERLVASIREGAAEIDGIAAITFTRKAAGEMRGRFFLRLRNEADSVSDSGERERILAALDEIDQCFIGTIHAFCGRLLRERPVEAGLSPDFAEMDDRDEMELRREAWDRFVQERYSEDDDRLAELEEHGIGTEDLYAFFGRRCQDADLRSKPTSTPRPDLEPYAKQVEAFVSHVSAWIPPNPEKRDKLMVAVRRAGHFLRNHGIGSDRDAARLLLLFDSKPGASYKNWVTLKHWSDKDAAKELRDVELPLLVEQTVRPGLRLWRECAYRLVTEFVDDAMAYYDTLRSEQGKLTFQDLLLKADRMLQSSPQVRSFFQKRYRTILVDEFQDTDPIQARILFYLTGTDVMESDWKKLSPRPGSLFLVGDDKQSIYRFRRADVEIFHFVARRIDETGGQVMHLNTSFRSLGNLCAWISDAFPAIFEREGAPYQAEFKPLFDSRPAGIDTHCVRKITVEKVHGNRKAEIAAQDAARIATFIAAAIRGETEFNYDSSSAQSRRGLELSETEAVERGALPEKASAGDFLILTRTTTQLSIYADALEAKGIPFDIVGGGRLADSPEVQAVVTLLETVYMPDDPVPFLAYLRGPLVGLSDAELYDYVQTGGRLQYGSSMDDGASGEGDNVPVAIGDRIAKAVDLLDSTRADLTSLPTAAALERILERYGLLALSSVHPDGGSSSRAGNLVRLLSLVRSRQARGWSWGRVVEDLREMVEDRSYKVEQMTLESGREDVVRVMNVHQAKGLQARIVFLADPYNLAHENEPTSHVSRSGDEPYLSMIVRKPKGDYNHEVVAQPAGWDEDRAEEERFDAAEEARLLYVAATRARDLLVVSRYPDKPGRGPWSPLYGFLENVPELRAPSVSRLDEAASPRHSFEELCRSSRTKLDRTTRMSYFVETVTGRRAEEELEYGSREGRGRDYGVVVHQLFEELVSGRLPASRREYIERLMHKAHLDEQMASDAAAALDRFESSTLWSEIRQAEEVHTEVPIGAPLNRDGKPGALRGIIDLAYRDKRGWHIRDYKTDAADTEADVERLRARYRGQLDEYEKYWSKLAGEPVVSADLWFVHGPDEERQLDLF